ncbi:MAG: response regulator transcription factor [Bacteroidota bacterium]
MLVLVAEDDPFTAQLLQQGLEQLGYRVHLAPDGAVAEDLALSTDYDCILCDWMMPKVDGPTLVRRLRTQGIQAPVLMLTARTSVAHRVDGLDAGADDYLTKPFAFQELAARVRALLRRADSTADPTQRSLGPLTLDLVARTARVQDTPITLRTMEFNVLSELIHHAGHVLTRTHLAERVWGSALMTTDDVINTTVSGLRRKLKAALAPHGGDSVVQLKTIRGIGYQLHQVAPSVHANP